MVTNSQEGVGEKGYIKDGFLYSIKKVDLKNRSNTGLKGSSLAVINNVTVLYPKGVDEYLLSVTDTATGKAAAANIVKKLRNGLENEYYLYHYDQSDNLIATVFVKDGKVVSILPAPNNGPAGYEEEARTASNRNCFERGYKQYKDFYSQGDWKEVACDLGNLFVGACTIGGVLAAAINCL